MNIASGQPRRIGDVLQTLLDLAGVHADIRIDTSRLRPTDIDRAVGDAGLADRLLGWVPRIPWEQTLNDVMSDWQRRVAIPRERPTVSG